MIEISILPLTHASSSLRSMAYGSVPNPMSLLLLAVYAAVFMIIANIVIIKRKNL